jgi:hypothetical protein
MRQILIVAALGWMATAALAKDHKRSDSSKEPAASPIKSGSTINDQEARRCILQRLVEKTGTKEWKIELHKLAGTSRSFVATSGSRRETGSINVARNYPNQGALRVYLVPKD